MTKEYGIRKDPGTEFHRLVFTGDIAGAMLFEDPGFTDLCKKYEGSITQSDGELIVTNYQATKRRKIKSYAIVQEVLEILDAHGYRIASKLCDRQTRIWALRTQKCFDINPEAALGPDKLYPNTINLMRLSHQMIKNQFYEFTREMDQCKDWQFMPRARNKDTAQYENWKEWLFCQCIGNGRAQFALALIQKYGVDINYIHRKGGEAGVNGWTLFMWACHYGSVQVVKATIDQVDVNYAAPDGCDALIAAAMGGKSVIARILLQHNAETTHVTTSGMNALDYACSRLFPTAHILRQLLARQMRPNIQRFLDEGYYKPIKPGEYIYHGTDGPPYGGFPPPAGTVNVAESARYYHWGRPMHLKGRVDRQHAAELIKLFYTIAEGLPLARGFSADGAALPSDGSLRATLRREALRTADDAAKIREMILEFSRRADAAWLDLVLLQQEPGDNMFIVSHDGEVWSLLF